MKKATAILIILFLVCSLACSAEVTVATTAELNTAIDVGDTPIHLNAATFVLTASKTIDSDSVLDIVYDGDVTIDGDATYLIAFNNATFAVGDSTYTNRLIFTNGAINTAEVWAISADTEVTFYNCDFSGALAGNCLDINATGTTYTLVVTCNYCNAFGALGAAHDGFNVTTTHSETVALNLNYCNAYDNVNDGATGHATGTTINIVGGSYHDNEYGLDCLGGCVVSISGAVIYNNSLNGFHHNGSAVINIDGAEFYNNGSNGAANTGADLLLEGTTVTNLTNSTLRDAAKYNNIRINDTAYLMVDNCVLSNPAGTSANILVATTGVVRIFNSAFSYDGAAPSTYGVNIGASCLTIDGCSFMGFNGSASAGIAVPPSAIRPLIKNSVFYGCTRGIHFYAPAQVINCIFDTCVTACYSGTADSTFYSLLKSDYNFFATTNTTNFSNVGTAGDHDITTGDPHFKDAVNGDYRLRTNSPCLNTGKPTLNSGYSSMGAWQRKSMLPFKYW